MKYEMNDLDGIIWTAIRSMMLDTDLQQITKNINCIKSLANRMSESSRQDQALDIRQNIVWNTVSSPEHYGPTEKLWTDLAAWLESDAKHENNIPLPSYRIAGVWIDIILHSLKYICHRHTYATSYVNDIVWFVPKMSKKQKARLHTWLKANVRYTDDKDIRKFTAAMDPDNRYVITASATKKQVKSWIARTPNVVHTDNIQAIPKTTRTCFRFEGGYCGVDDYFAMPYQDSSVIEEFITDIKKLEVS